jgi:hypothetical protein
MSREVPHGSIQAEEAFKKMLAEAELEKAMFKGFPRETPDFVTPPQRRHGL